MNVRLALLSSLASGFLALSAIADDDATSERLSGNWGGARLRWEEKGMSPFANYTLDGLVLLKGGIDRGQSLAGVLDLGVDLDFEKAAVPIPGGLRVQGLYLHGDDPSAERVGDYNYLSNIVDEGGFRLYQAFYSWERDGSHVKAGLMACDEDFATNPASSVFVNSAFAGVPMMSGSLTAPIWPRSSLGIALHQRVATRTHVHVGIFDGHVDDDSVNGDGTRIELDRDEGALVLLELEHAWDLERFRGRAKVGGWANTGKLASYPDGEEVRRNHGFHALLEQALTADQRWTGFARWGHMPREDRTDVRTHLDLGVTVSAPLFQRKDDVAGLGYFRTGFSSDYLASRLAEESIVTDSESGLELTYSLKVTRGVWLQPDLQYIFSPHESGSDALAGILRLYAEF